MGTTFAFERSLAVGFEPSIQMYSARYTLMRVSPSITCGVGFADGRQRAADAQLRQRDG
jgi:hypothetical protein